ncbi:MAG TPA: hypothetical protein VLE89_03885 [Chlamydiales bacterium]|nr:hypothetical protein [Chlamydiales bacterium]
MNKFLFFILFAAALSGVEVDVNAGNGYYYDDDEYYTDTWYGPGLYWGVWYDNEDDWGHGHHQDHNWHHWNDQSHGGHGHGGGHH